MFYCGIDIAKHKHEMSVIDSDGKALFDSVLFTNSKDGCAKVIALRQFSRYRLALVDSCGDCKRRIIALLDQDFSRVCQAIYRHIRSSLNRIVT